MKIFIWSLCLFASIQLASQTTANQHNYQYKIKRTTDEISIDGELNEAVWKSAQVAGNFIYSFPVDDRPSEEEYQTEVMVSYDDRNIYVAAILHGVGPYMIPTLKRDAGEFWSGEVFTVIFDPVNEKNLGFEFSTNTASVQFDNLVATNLGTRSNPNGSGFNTAWDNTWSCSSKSYEDYWVTEMAIPLKTMRYGKNKVWGINFGRNISANNSFHTWAPVPVQFMMPDLSYNGCLVWDEAPPISNSKVALIPYILASHSNEINPDKESINSLDIGGDAKIALTSNLNLDVTINPDFSQVDVDEQVTNLTTVNIRFPERRLFFLENSDIFSDFGIPPMRPFFSRRIGLDDDGNSIPILYGARLSGNLTSDLRVGLMNLQTASNDEFLGQNYSSLAFTQRLFGRSRIKGYFHNRQAFDEGEFSSTNYTRVWGMEFEYLSLDGSLRLNGGGGMSLTEDVSEKRGTYHWIISYNNRNITAYWNVMTIENNYVADIGFMMDQFHFNAVTEESIPLGYHHHFARFAYTTYPKAPAINTQSFRFRSVNDWTTESNTLFIGVLNASYGLNFANSASFEIGGERRYRQLLFPFGFTDAEPLPAGEYNWYTFNASYSSDNRKPFFWSAGVELGGFYNGKRQTYSAEINYRQQPWGNFSLGFDQNFLEFPDPFGSETLTLIGPKFEFNFSKDLFWTTFLQYNTQQDNFNINSRFQWQFSPLSNLFIVYSDNYAIEQWGPKNRALVVKLNYWLNL